MLPKRKLVYSWYILVNPFIFSLFLLPLSSLACSLAVVIYLIGHFFALSLSLLLIRTIRACRYRTLLITCVGVSCTDNSVFLSFLNINDHGRLKVYYNVPITKSTRILVIVILVSHGYSLPKILIDLQMT